MSQCNCRCLSIKNESEREFTDHELIYLYSCKCKCHSENIQTKTLRDEFAISVLESTLMICGTDGEKQYQLIEKYKGKNMSLGEAYAHYSYEMADYMMKAREKKE